MTVRLVCAFQWQRSLKGVRGVCVCVHVHVHVYMCVLAGWYSLAAFDCKWGDYIELIMYDPNMYNSCRSHLNSLP